VSDAGYLCLNRKLYMTEGKEGKENRERVQRESASARHLAAGDVVFSKPPVSMTWWRNGLGVGLAIIRSWVLLPVSARL